MLIVLLLAVAALGPPSAPTVSGPRESENPRVTYTFRARAQGVPASKVRFRCGVDGAGLRACRSPYTLTLSVGTHVLRVRAVAPGGVMSGATAVRIRILEPRVPEIRVGASPLNVIAVGRTLWTENYGDGTVSIVEPDTRAVTRVTVGGQPGGIAYGAGAVWVSDLAGGMLSRVDPAGRVTARIALGGAAAGIAVAGGVVYVADYSGGLTRVDATTNTILGRTALPGRPEAVAVGFGRVWVTNENGMVSTLDPATGAVDGPLIPVGDDVDDVSIGADAVWAVALYGRTLARIDPATRAITARIRTAGQASGVLATGDSVWVANYDLATVSRVDPAQSRIVRTYRVGRQPRGFAEAAGAVWVANQNSDSISRITP